MKFREQFLIAAIPFGTSALAIVGLVFLYMGATNILPHWLLIPISVVFVVGFYPMLRFVFLSTAGALVLFWPRSKLLK